MSADGRYTYTAFQDHTVQFEGETIELKQGEAWSTDDPCQMLGFIGAVGGPVSEDTVTVQELRTACAAQRGQSGQPPPPADPDAGQPATGTAVTDESADAPPVEPDDGTQQGAPDVDRSGTVGSGDRNQGDPVAPEEESRRPPDGEEHPTRSGEHSDQRNEAGEPVDLFSGAYVVRAVDLDVPAPIMPLRFVRTYRSGDSSFGPLGFNWDHNYNVYLRPLATGDVARWTGAGREDRFAARGDGGFDPPRGVFERLERLPGPGDRFELVLPHGERHRFERPAGWIDPERIPLVEIADRHGNRQQLRYGPRDLLLEVVDDDGRALRFEHEPCGMVNAVTDHAGRRVTYHYHPEIENLAEVRLPATDDFPDGERTIYEYDYPSPFQERRHNIVRVLDDRGAIVLENAYDPDPASFAYNRVVRQRFCDDVFDYAYASVQYAPPRDEFVNVPVVRTEARYPDGSLTTFTFNFRGDMLDRRTRLTRDRSFRVVFEQFAYDEQGNPARVVAADGGIVETSYDAANPDPCARGNVLRIELRPSAAFPVPSRVLWRGSYEPTHQLVRESIAEGGHRTRYEYDLDAPAPGATGKLVRIRYPDATLPDGTIQPAERRFEHNARGQVTAEVTPGGIRNEYVYVTAGGADNGRLESVTFDAGGAPATETLSYDAFGFVAETVDGSGVRVRTIRNARGQLVAHERPATGLGAGRVEFAYGLNDQLRRIVRPAGEFDDGVVAPGGTIVDELEHDPRGRLVRALMGANTASPRVWRMCHDHAGRVVCVHDPAGATLRRRYDERGLLIEESSHGGGTQGPVTRLRYDRVGRLVEVILPDGQRARQRLDAFGRADRLTRPDGGEERLAYGDGDLVVLRELHGDPGDGVARLLGRVRFEHDERGRERRRRIASFRDDPAAAVELETTFEHDPDDRVVRIVDHRGAATTATFAGERLVHQADAAGNEVAWEYDGAYRVTAMTTTQLERGAPRSRRWEQRYDGRGRLVERIDPDGTAQTIRYDDRDLAVELGGAGVAERRAYGLLGELLRRELDPGGLAIADERRYDPMGRVVEYRDPLGEVSRIDRDGIGREVATRFADGATYARTWGPDGRVASETTPNGTTVSYQHDAVGRVARMAVVAGPGLDPVPEHRFAYDALDRLVRASAGGAVVERRFDSLGRLISEQAGGATVSERHDDLAGTVERTYPDGRVERVTLDLLGRATAIAEVAGGTLGGADPDLLAVTYAGLNDWERIELPGGLVATARYDDRERLTALEWSAGGVLVEAAHYRFDERSRRRVELLEGTPPLARRATPDGIDRLVRVEEGFAPPALGDADTQAEHDADIAAAAGGAAAVQESWALSAASERLTETRTGSPPVAYGYGPGHVLSSLDGQPVTSYPDGHRRAEPGRAYEIDALGRLVRVRDGGGAPLGELTYDALGRLASATEGGTTRTLRHFGGLAVQEDRGGAPFRQWTEHPGVGVPLLVHRAGAVQARAYGATLELLALVDHAGAPVAHYRYRPFGEPAVFDGGGAPLAAPDEEPSFGGMPYLAAAGLYWTPRRAYDPATGLWLARDPAPFVDSPSPFLYATHAPLDRLDPEGELPFLAVLGLVALGGALVGGGVSAGRQAVGIASGERTEPFSWGEVGIGALTGGVLAPALVLAPELAIPLAGYGLYSAADEARQGHYWTAGFDAILAIAPFKSARVRTATTGRGTVFGWARGMGRPEGWSTRSGRLFTRPEGFRPPGVAVRQVQFEGVTAWEKTVATRIPGLRFWAESTIRAQQRGLRQLEQGNVPAARILQEYQPGGRLVVEDVRPLANEALAKNPSLRPAYDSYYRDAARALGWPRAGRVPFLRQLLHDLRPDNIGYTADRGFVAFDPAVDLVSLAVATAVVGAGTAALVTPSQANAAEPPRESRLPREPERIPGDTGGPAPATGSGGGGKP